ncbi:MAG: YibE/F family protein [Treponema sp.]|nr:YibE/F family protein [Treponema sp.]
MLKPKKEFDLKKEIYAIIATFLSIGFIILIAPHITEGYRQHSMFNQQFVSGTVLKIIENNIEEDPFVDGRYIGNQKILVRINEGEYQGQEFESTNTLSSLRSAVAYEGLSAVFTIRIDKNNKPVVWIYNYNRTPFVYALAIVLSALVIFVGKFKGLRSLLALLFTGVVLLYVTVPGMWTPHPMFVAICSLAVICVVSFILIAGVTKKSMVATMGTVAGILLAGFLTYFLGKIMNLSGVDMEKGESLLYLAQNRNFKISSLLFVSILISCLGATMDIAVSIASSAEQLYLANPAMPLKQYFASIMAVGRDIIGTMTNTLILAFCGASLPLAMMIWGYHMDYPQFINIPIIVIKILQALAGSIGMVASVVFTALLSVMIFRREGSSKK